MSRESAARPDLRRDKSRTNTINSRGRANHSERKSDSRLTVRAKHALVLGLNEEIEWKVSVNFGRTFPEVATSFPSGQSLREGGFRRVPLRSKGEFSGLRHIRPKGRFNY